MADTNNFEMHRAQLAASLSAMVNSMRDCAEMAETFATFVQGSKFPLPDTVASGGKGKRKAAGDEEGDKKRKRKAPKDPNAPKRPPSSYLMFQNEIRKELKEKYPDISNAELLAMISDQWKHMSEEHKEVYHAQSMSLKERYSQSKAAYDNRTPEEVAAADAATAAAIVEKKENAKKARKAKAAETAAAAAARPPPPAAELSTSESGSDDDGSEVEEEEVLQEKESSGDGSGSSSEEEDEEEPTPKRSKKSVTAVTQPAKKGKKNSKA